jgi:signal transduction histidine kinase
VYFSCLEAVQNAAKHAGAARVDVVLESHDDGLEFRIVDDGRGFDPGEVDASGSGLANMRDRVAAVGGELVVRSLPGEGTRVEGRIPVQRGRLEPVT